MKKLKWQLNGAIIINPENEKIKKVSLNVAKERVARVFGVE